MKLSRSLALGILAALARARRRVRAPGRLHDASRPTARPAHDLPVPRTPTTDAASRHRARSTRSANDGYAHELHRGHRQPGRRDRDQRRPLLVNYRAMAGTWRDTIDAGDQALRTPGAQTNLQAHATCAGVGRATTARASSAGRRRTRSTTTSPWQKHVGRHRRRPGRVDRGRQGRDRRRPDSALDTRPQVEAALHGEGGTYYRGRPGVDASPAAPDRRRKIPLQSQITHAADQHEPRSSAGQGRRRRAARRRARPEPAPRALTLTLSAKQVRPGRRDGHRRARHRRHGPCAAVLGQTRRS